MRASNKHANCISGALNELPNNLLHATALRNAAREQWR
jgi:hypothetical protein